jgi:hypothetical protein
MMGIDEVMADEVAMEEEAELDALLGHMNQQDLMALQSAQQNEMDSLLFEMNTSNHPTAHAPHQPYVDTPYGSDDEEYDHIFMDVIQEENRIASQQQPPEDQDMMDLS